jgi:hypothetical protein
LFDLTGQPAHVPPRLFYLFLHTNQAFDKLFFSLKKE